jgi:hypothetical protein
MSVQKISFTKLEALATALTQADGMRWTAHRPQLQEGETVPDHYILRSVGGEELHVSDEYKTPKISLHGNYELALGSSPLGEKARARDFLPYKREADSICVGIDRPALTAAKDIVRRLLPGYRENLNRAAAAKKAWREEEALRRRAAALLRPVVGTEPWDKNRHSSAPDYLPEFRAYYPFDESGRPGAAVHTMSGYDHGALTVEVEIRGPGVVKVEIENLTPEAAAELIRLATGRAQLRLQAQTRPGAEALLGEETQG